MSDTIKKIILIIIIIVLMLFTIMVTKSVKAKKMREENKLYTTLNQVATDFYKDYYYKIVLGSDEESRLHKAEYLKEVGINISLRELAKYKINDEDSILSQFKNYKTHENCDYDKTKISIYPQEPYGESDIRIETNIVCGF